MPENIRPAVVVAVVQLCMSKECVGQQQVEPFDH